MCLALSVLDTAAYKMEKITILMESGGDKIITGNITGSDATWKIKATQETEETKLILRLLATCLLSIVPSHRSPFEVLPQRPGVGPGYGMGALMLSVLAGGDDSGRRHMDTLCSYLIGQGRGHKLFQVLVSTSWAHTFFSNTSAHILTLDSGPCANPHLS